MKVGISPDEWANSAADCLRAPIVQGILASLALHLAIAVLFQPAPGSGMRHTLVINARLQPPVSPSEATPTSPESVENIPIPDPHPTAQLLMATTPSPAPPIPQLAMPEREHVVASSSPQTPPPTLAATATLEVAPSTAQPADRSSGIAPQASGLPSLPLGIDTTWYSARQVDVHPKAIGLIEPAYPERAKENDIEGSIKLMLKIDDLGRVQEAEVVEAVPPGMFEEAALAAFRDARFRPAMRDGRPVRYQAYMRVEFKLKD